MDMPVFWLRMRSAPAEKGAIFHPRCEVEDLATPYSRGEAELRGERRRMNMIIVTMHKSFPSSEQIGESDAIHLT